MNRPFGSAVGAPIPTPEERLTALESRVEALAAENAVLVRRINDLARRISGLEEEGDRRSQVELARTAYPIPGR